MQHISDVVSQAVGANRPPRTPNQPDPEQFRAAAGVINRLFADLQALFPAWRQSYPGQADLAAAKRSWTRALVESGVTTEEQLQWGLRRARRSNSPFWPSVGQFIQWCQPDPESLGLPSPEDAYREACAMAHPAADHSRWSHPAVRVAAREISSHDLCTLPATETRRLFIRAYEIAVRRVADGEDLSAEIPRGLPEQPAPRPADPETARRHLNRMRQLLRA
ncbi:replication protein P [Marinobacter vinifirmus]